FPVEAGASSEDQESQKQLAETVGKSVSGCADMARAAEEIGGPPATQPQRLRVGDLAPRIREIVTPLAVGEASAPIRIDRGLLLLMVCSREEPPSNMPTREEIAEDILRQRLDLL